jgi:hypothetical protein
MDLSFHALIQLGAAQRFQPKSGHPNQPLTSKHTCDAVRTLMSFIRNDTSVAPTHAPKKEQMCRRLSFALWERRNAKFGGSTGYQRDCLFRLITAHWLGGTVLATPSSADEYSGSSQCAVELSVTAVDD